MSEASSKPTTLTTSEVIERVPERALFVVIGFVQGLLAAGLTASDDWLGARPAIYFPIWLLVVTWPVLFMLSFSRKDRLRALAWVSGFCVLLSLLALYTGWQLTPHGEFSQGNVHESFIATMLFTSFVALLHLQSNVWRLERSYDSFFTLSWRNLLTFGLSAALTYALWLVLYLWKSLFEAIGIEFFDELFKEPWFFWPVLAAVFAFGLSSFREATTVLDSISSLLVRLTWLLLPLLLFIIGAFLLTLPFVGLQPLWGTDSGTTILMVANFLGLLFLNAVYQTGKRIPYPIVMHRVLTASIGLLPVVSALACYGAVLRVAQYGWTVSRCWALLIILLMACFSLGYLSVILRQRIEWHRKLPEINKFMSWVVLASLLLTASPLANFRAISAWSQFGPIEAGEATIYQLDVRYVSRRLARPGYLRMQSLHTELAKTDPDNAQELQAAYEEARSVQKLKLPWSAEQRAMTVVRPDSIAVPEGVWDALRDLASSEDPVPRLLIEVGLNAIDPPEYVAIWLYDHGATTRIHAQCIYRRDDRWKNCGDQSIDSEQPMGSLLGTLVEGDIETVVPIGYYRDLRIGDWVFDLR